LVSLLAWMLECPSLGETSADLLVLVLPMSSVPRLQQNINLAELDSNHANHHLR
jgi:hypothetical protein